MKYSFHEAAEEEFFVAIEYYEECYAGLGLKFSEEVFATIKLDNFILNTYHIM